jgi:hypothetical protein
MSYRCPKCNGIIYDRRNNICGFCGAELPASLLLSPSEMAALDKAAGGTEQDKDLPVESVSNRLASFLRDCMLGLIALAMIGWLVYVGISGIVTGHLDLHFSVRASRRWFTKPLDGLPAVLAGFSFLCLAATFASICTAHPLLATRRIPSWVRVSYWWFFAGWAVLYFTARFLSGA